jgi:hypothetical protein
MRKFVLTLAVPVFLMALAGPASAYSPPTAETYSMTGYEVYFGADHAVFVGTGAGTTASDLSGWYTSVYHTLSVSPGSVTGGQATLQRIDGVRISGNFSGGDVAQTYPGYDCTTETHAVTALMSDVTRSDRFGVTGTAVMMATLTHYHTWFLGTCYTYSARVDATITVII